jgi:hypothetical protein
MEMNAVPQFCKNDGIGTPGSENKVSRRRVLGSLLAGAALGAIPSAAQSLAAQENLSLGRPVAVSVPLDYVGLSYETAQLADPTFFADDNRELVSLFRSQSQHGVLRIGGNSSEFCWWKRKPGETPPAMPASSHNEGNWMPQEYTAIEPIAIDRLAGFLGATGWRAIYGLNLGTGAPQRDAEEAAYVAKTLGSRLLYFQIGNEPEYYKNANTGLRPPNWNFDQYIAQWTTFARAVIERVPGARFGGPDVGSDDSWVVRFAQEAPKLLPGRIVACTEHYYAEGPPDSPRATVAGLLSGDARIDRDLPRIVEAAGSAGIVYRMTEGNTCYRGGKPGMSNAFCSALWAADYLLKLASYGCAGVNLHGGGSKQIRAALGGHLPGEQLDPGAEAAAKDGSFYTPIAGSRELGFKARPVLYGMKLASVLAGGRMRPVSLGVVQPMATAYAADMEGAGTRVVIINKHASSNLQVRLESRHGAKIWRLEAPSLTATAGVTLAGAPLDAANPWKPIREEQVTSEAGFLTINVGAASAVALFSDHRLA